MVTIEDTDLYLIDEELVPLEEIPTSLFHSSGIESKYETSPILDEVILAYAIHNGELYGVMPDNKGFLYKRREITRLPEDLEEMLNRGEIIFDDDATH